MTELQWLGGEHCPVPLFLTIPHSGETLPEECDWLRGLPERLLLTDVDRFVDRLYAPGVTSLGVPALVARTHRYAVDLNRFPADVDCDSVEGSLNESGVFPKGFHWVRTTVGEVLMKAPISRQTHERLVARCHDTFHAEIERRVATLRARSPARPRGPIFQLDCHSMPSLGTGAHADSGQRRADAVISDFEGKSADPRFKDLVLSAYEAEGFQCSYNWPYKGGRITQRYGRPAAAHHTLQIELNRALYMDESTREPLPGFAAVAARLGRALSRIVQGLESGLEHLG